MLDCDRGAGAESEGEAMSENNQPDFDRTTVGGLQSELKCRCEEYISQSDPNIVTESDAIAIRAFVKYVCAMYGVSK